jgi:hypothetical protein
MERPGSAGDTRKEQPEQAISLGPIACLAIFAKRIERGRHLAEISII